MRWKLSGSDKIVSIRRNIRGSLWPSLKSGSMRVDSAADRHHALCMGITNWRLAASARARAAIRARIARSRRATGSGILALALAGCTSSAPTPTQDADPALWVVRDADTTIYLFGTVHMLKPGLSWFDEAVRKAFDESQELVLEVVMPPGAEMNAIVAELGTTAGPTLPGQLAPEDAAKLRAALPEFGMDAHALDHSEPWLAATLLASLPLQKLGYDQKDGAEAVLTAAARASGKSVTGLETVRQQLGYFDALPLPAQRALLRETLRGLADAGKSIDKAVAAWSAGDPDALAALMNEDMAKSPDLADALLYKRNRIWADWIARRMERPGTVFVAVGAGHLAGKGDVQGELARRGLSVQRIDY